MQSTDRLQWIEGNDKQLYNNLLLVIVKYMGMMQVN